MHPTASAFVAGATWTGSRFLAWGSSGALGEAMRQAFMHRNSHLDDPGFVPVLSDGDLAAHAVWSASRAAVRDVWVGGRHVVRDGECLTIDVAEARRRVQAAAARLVG